VDDLREIIHYVAASFWAAIGLAYEYPAALIGGGTHFRWGGMGYLLSVVFHVTVLVIILHPLYDHHAQFDQGYPLSLLLMLSFYLYTAKLNGPAVDQFRELVHFTSQGYDPRVPVVKQVDEPRELTEEEVISYTKEAAAILHLPADLPIRDVLKGCPLRLGKQRKRDWLIIGRQLSTLVVYLPCLKGISSLQYRRLMLQMMMQIRNDTATRISTPRNAAEGEEFSSKEKVVPLSTFQVMMLLFSKWLKLPFWFAMTLLGAIAVSAVSPLQALLSGNVISALSDGNPDTATWNLIGWGIVTLSQILTNYFITKCHSTLNTRVAAWHRDKILSVALRGGTDFHEETPAGKIVDIFSSQVSRLEYAYQCHIQSTGSFGYCHFGNHCRRNRGCLLCYLVYRPYSGFVQH